MQRAIRETYVRKDAQGSLSKMTFKLKLNNVEEQRTAEIKEERRTFVQSADVRPAQPQRTERREA